MKSSASYDFLVLGAGTAGCAVVRSLAARHPAAKIALVERGSRGYPLGVLHVPALQPYIMSRWGQLAHGCARVVRGVPEDTLGGRSLEFVRGCGLGGSSLINDLRYVRATRADMEAWKDPDWSFDTLLKHYRSLESNERGDSTYHGSDGPLRVTNVDRSNADTPLNVRFFEACESAGVPSLTDVNEGSADGFTCVQSTIQRGSRVDVFDAMIQRQRHSMPNVEVLTGTEVESIVFERGKAVCVLAYRKGRMVQLDGRRIVVCLGTLGSPVLLQRSGIRREGPVVDNAAVGQNLILGCTADIVFRIHNPVDHLPSRSLSFSNAAYLHRQWQEYREGGTGIFSSLIEAAAFVRSQPSQPSPDLSLTLYRSPQVAWHGWRSLMPVEGFTIRVAHHYPVSRGEVRVDAATGRTTVRSGLLSEKDDVLRMDEGIQWVGLFTSKDSNLRSVFHTDREGNHVGSFSSLHLSLHHPSTKLSTQRDVAAFLGEHACGTPDMFGTCALHTVVDSRLHVRGVDGVVVADASVVPAPTIANSSILGGAIGRYVGEIL